MRSKSQIPKTNNGLAPLIYFLQDIYLLNLGSTRAHLRRPRKRQRTDVDAPSASTLEDETGKVLFRLTNISVSNLSRNFQTRRQIHCSPCQRSRLAPLVRSVQVQLSDSLTRAKIARSRIIIKGLREARHCRDTMI